MNAIPRTPDEFARMVADYARRLNEDAAFAEIVGALCGSQSAARLFAQPRGVSIAAFARLVDLPPSTVRHYQRLGLITPYEVNGKFRFFFHNVAQAESVRQWRDLGLSLDDIKAQRAQGRIGGQSATFAARGQMSAKSNAFKGVNVLLTSKDALHGGDWQLYVERPPDGALPWPSGIAKSGLLITSRDVFGSGPAETDWQRAMERTRLEVRAARIKLEERLGKLREQLARAKTLEAALEQHTARR